MFKPEHLKIRRKKQKSSDARSAKPAHVLGPALRSSHVKIYDDMERGLKPSNPDAFVCDSRALSRRSTSCIRVCLMQKDSAERRG